MLDDIYGFLMRWLPRYEQNDRSYMTVAIGCTGGQHRSVVIANVVGERLSRENLPFTMTHRDLAQAAGV